METADFIDILNHAARIAGIEPDQASTEEFADLRLLISDRLKVAWEQAEWRDLMRVEKRYFRPLFTPGNTYNAPTLGAVSEVYWPQQCAYYQSLRALPLTVSGIVRTGTTAEATTSANHLLSTGDQIAISGATQTDYNLTATITVTGPTTFTYEVANSPATPATGTIRATPTPTNATGIVNAIYWALAQTEYSGNDWAVSETNTAGHNRRWPGTDRFYQYINTSDSAGNQPTNTTYWAVLTDFERYVAFEQSGETAFSHPVRGWDRNPRTDGRAVEVNSFTTDLGLHVLDSVAFVWVDFRLRPPALIGEVWSDSATYAAGDQVYYSSSTTRGNFYDVLSATTAGQDPEDTPAKFSLVEIPEIFRSYLIHGAASDYLSPDGDETTARREFQIADRELERQLLINDQAKAHLNRTEVLTR
jgi:hypothetical protein